MAALQNNQSPDLSVIQGITSNKVLPVKPTMTAPWEFVENIKAFTEQEFVSTITAALLEFERYQEMPQKHLSNISVKLFDILKSYQAQPVSSDEAKRFFEQGKEPAYLTQLFNQLPREENDLFNDFCNAAGYWLPVYIQDAYQEFMQLPKDVRDGVVERYIKSRT